MLIGQQRTEFNHRTHLTNAVGDIVTANQHSERPSFKLWVCISVSKKYEREKKERKKREKNTILKCCLQQSGSMKKKSHPEAVKSKLSSMVNLPLQWVSVRCLARSRKHKLRQCGRLDFWLILLRLTMQIFFLSPCSASLAGHAVVLSVDPQSSFTRPLTYSKPLFTFCRSLPD